VAPEVVDLLVERGYSPHFGARFLQREIEKTLTSALAVEIVKKPLPPGTPVRVETRADGSVVASAEVHAPREATAQVVLPTQGAGAVRRRLDKKSPRRSGEPGRQSRADRRGWGGPSPTPGARACCRSSRRPTSGTTPPGGGHAARVPGHRSQAERAGPGPGLRPSRASW
jgi:hypothetical protein